MGCKATTVRDPQAREFNEGDSAAQSLKKGEHRDVSGPVSELSVQLRSGKPNHLKHARSQSGDNENHNHLEEGKQDVSDEDNALQASKGKNAHPSGSRAKADEYLTEEPRSGAAQPNTKASRSQAEPQAEAAQQHSRAAPAGTPALPSVPPTSWYAKAFTEAPANTAITDFHYQNKGRVVFAKRPLPLAQADLVKLPNRMPVTCTDFEIGKDLLYGVGFLHNTPLYIEHHWRSRVAHVENVKKGRVQLPPVVLRREQQRQKAMAAATASSRPDDDQRDEEATKRGKASSSATKIALKMDRGEATVFNHPYFDMLVGLKVYINDELIPDHYPTARSVPQCTATIDTIEAVNHWVSVPFVLMGYLNHATLDVISLYRTLSLTFVEHILRLKAPKSSADGQSMQKLSLRVEVIYGCRAEAYFCTEFISRGACTLWFSSENKPALKSYEEKLRALILAHRSTNQIVRAAGSGSRKVRACVMCGYPLGYRCTVCGAELCGSPVCSNHVFAGYPTGCSYHKPVEY